MLLCLIQDVEDQTPHVVHVYGRGLDRKLVSRGGEDASVKRPSAGSGTRRTRPRVQVGA